MRSKFDETDGISNKYNLLTNPVNHKNILNKNKLICNASNLSENFYF